MSARDLPLNDLLALAAGSSTRIDLHARVEAGATVGDGCTVNSGAVVARGTRLGHGVQVAANAVFVAPEDGERGTVVGDGARIGANAVVHAGLAIGTRARVQPGAVVLRDVPPGAVVAGNPAVVVGHVNSAPLRLSQLDA